MTSYHYNGLTSSVIGGDEWTLAAEISLNCDAADRLKQVYRRDGGEGRWQGTSSIGYDFLGRKTGMSDADLGNWSYYYNALGQLTRQTDARDRTSCLYYDSLGRMRGRVQRTDESCAATGGRRRPRQFLRLRLPGPRAARLQRQREPQLHLRQLQQRQPGDGDDRQSGAYQQL